MLYSIVLYSKLSYNKFVKKERKLFSKKFAVPSEGATEEGCGGNFAAPERSAGAKRRRVNADFAFWICVSDLAK
ncbi:MAG: hypothetical protein A2669_01900 [Candidatus Yanofskybacteria bacterium RIFCSPHIGHO2_01_FULL_48_25b]|uniref:Uncharacterized protein n=1 Tax=Candidatus Yanofskybacteria bacterium RIFCSPHIGHO2_01_FULL_48_25b TaxID=1802672 RepID=A0A1F8F4C3_9BACT|nr:MAG: hypothetical protein A2669_01900 [Candidatus Yanofskybacteria bacterium RIFCSPHIGHO2_01_FULL_48_25b]